jgi:hypothetical protein
LLISADKQDLHLVAGAFISVIIQVLRLTGIAIIYAENFLAGCPSKVLINVTFLLHHERLFHQDEVSLVVVRNALDCELSFFFKITVYFDKDLIRPLVYNFWPASIRTFILRISLFIWAIKTVKTCSVSRSLSHGIIFANLKSWVIKFLVEVKPTVLPSSLEILGIVIGVFVF